MFRNREELASTPEREVALDCVAAGVAAAHPERVVREAVRVEGDTLHVADENYDLAAFAEVVVLGAGKPAGRVATVLADVLGDRLDGGVVVTSDPGDAGPVDLRPGGHPVPDEDSVAGTEALLERARACGEDTLVLAVVAGGGSALMCAPAAGLTLGDLQATTAALLDSGATIRELNAVRKHLSAVKGGRLARELAPATVVGLVLSDVVGDDLGTIASGPLAPDDTTYGDALAVLDAYDLDVPGAVRAHLEAGARGERTETPKAGEDAVERVTHRVLATNFTALAAARGAAADAGYDAVILSSRVEGEAREAAKSHVAVAAECRATGNPAEPPVVLLAGGETTVTVRGEGTGGPNAEFALSAAMRGEAGVTVASVDTDGVDGTSDAAGALVDADTVEDARAAGAALRANDAAGYLAERDALVRTGPTGTNVNDLRVVVVTGTD